jgi:phytoene dehydrogenase-like protein
VEAPVTDAVVIGASHNGLVAANAVADAGWSLAVLEAQPHAGSAVRSAELLGPGCTSDLFSAFYPMAAASPALRALDLESWGLQWSRAPFVLANLVPDGRCAILSTDVDEIAAFADALAPEDGDRWKAEWRRWQAIGRQLVDVFLGSFPPLAAGRRLALSLRRDLLDFARFALLPVRRLSEEHFAVELPGLFLAGNAGHSSLAPKAVLRGFHGWFMSET